jgi:hypothetical protein
VNQSAGPLTVSMLLRVMSMVGSAFLVKCQRLSRWSLIRNRMTDVLRSYR